MIIAVGSDNPVKIGAVQDAFELITAYPRKWKSVKVEGFTVESGVARQPMSDSECIEGAFSRAVKALELSSYADFAVGIESGLCRISYGGGRWFERTWAVVLHKNGKDGLGSGAGFFVPDFVVEKIKADKIGLGSSLDERLGRQDVKKEEGYVGVVTNQVITRRSVTRDAIISAFSVFIKPELFIP